MSGWLERFRGYILITLINLIVIGGTQLLLQRNLLRGKPTLIIEKGPTPTPKPTSTPRPLLVYVSGAVANPDVYTLPPETIVKDAIKAAGGPTKEADLNRINLAQRVHDEEHIYVPKVGEEKPPITPQPTPQAQAGGKININTATVEELETLPGIGPTYAQRIIEYRQEKGPFKSIEEIKNVQGIGEATFEKFKDMITVRP